MSGSQTGMIVAGVSLSRADVTNAAVTMFYFEPLCEAYCPGAGFVEFGKTLGARLGGKEQRFGKGIIGTNARPGLRGSDAQPGEHRHYRRGLERDVSRYRDRHFVDAPPTRQPMWPTFTIESALKVGMRK